MKIMLLNDGHYEQITIQELNKMVQEINKENFKNQYWVDTIEFIKVDIENNTLYIIKAQYDF